MSKPRFKFNISYPLTVVGAVLFVILGALAFSASYHYLRLTARMQAQIDQWKVIKKSSSSYPLRATYHFEIQDKTYQNSSVLLPPHHLNRPSAEKALSQLEKKAWHVWYDPQNPSISSLEKRFPAKKIVYALIALGITLYFWFVETNSKIRNPTN